ncbi:hypothetical protein Tco_1340144, partial [Tanacetum coccineum]
AAPPPPEHIESVGDDIETLRANSLRIARGRITRSKLRVVYADQEDSEASCARDEAAEHQAKTLHVSLGAARMDVRDLIESREADRFEMAELRSQAQDIEASF